MRFLGSIDAKPDAKGRAFLPSAFRKILQASGCESLVLRKDVFQPCVVIYPLDIWDRQIQELRDRLSVWNAHEQMLFRQYISEAEPITPDANGRILLPKRFIEGCELTDSIRFIGMGDTIEIWNAKKISSSLMQTQDFSTSLDHIMGGEYMDTPSKTKP